MELLNNARNDIEAARKTALSKLRQESAELAIGLAGKLVGENLDDEKNQVLINNFIKQL